MPDTQKRHVLIGSDHAGLTLKAAVRRRLEEQGHTVEDVGVHEAMSVDYPVYAYKVAERIADNPSLTGILVCGTGVGMCMAANRVPEVRAALCCNEHMARMARAHNDANILCLGERILGLDLALAITDVFMTTDFEAGRHARRIEMFDGR
jgi:ribose 5-phosphate isomerase B